MTKKIIFSISILLNLFFCALLINRFINLKPDYTGPDNYEIFRSTSPDSLFDAVYQAESEGGALGSTVFQAYIVPIGRKSMPREQFLEGVHIDSCRISWSNDSVVCFNYRSARILNFNNIVWMKKNDGGDKMFEIKLHSDRW